ncbi:dTDP-glucose 4,6-dehydratase [candidate division KSB1 bacterium]
MNLLITGGAGFIGSNFIRLALNSITECKIVNLDKLTYAGNLDNLKDVENHPNYTFIKGDICDRKILEEIMGGIDVVIHFAAETHVDKSIKDAGIFIDTDVKGTYLLLDVAYRHNVKRFIHISTDEVYGEISEGSFRETDPLNPRNPYSASKTAADRLAYSFFCTYNFPVIIARSSNNFGPYQHPEKIIPLFITNLLEDKNVPLYGDGLNERDWIYVKDNCEAILFLLNNGIIGEVYNVGGGNEVSNINLTKLILNFAGKQESYIEYVKDRPGHDKRYSLDCGKIKKLGWEPRHVFDTAFASTLQWYMDNEWWWEKVKSGEFKDYYNKHYKNIHNMKKI